MSTASDASSALQTNPEKENFQRLSRLLIKGGTRVLKELLDFVLLPSRLPSVLNDPEVRARLTEANLYQQQWNCLYPASGGYGESSNFDITLLFLLLRWIVWDKLQAPVPETVFADLHLVHSYRNTVYAHAKTMEIIDDEFDDLWAVISGALVRLAKYISKEKRKEWTKAIKELRIAPLTPGDERNVKELEKWYRSDYDTQKMVGRMHEEMTMGFEQVNKKIDGLYITPLELLSNYCLIIV